MWLKTHSFIHFTFSFTVLIFYCAKFIILAASRGNRLVFVRLALCPIGILTVNSQGSTCGAASIHFGPTIRSDHLLSYLQLNLSANAQLTQTATSLLGLLSGIGTRSTWTHSNFSLWTALSTTSTQFNLFSIAVITFDQLSPEVWISNRCALVL